MEGDEHVAHLKGDNDPLDVVEIGSGIISTGSVVEVSSHQLSCRKTTSNTSAT